MLIQFSFKNFGPFREKAVLDMRAVKSYKEHEYNLADAGAKDKLLKVAAIYGANASGKSNFVDAYASYVRIVLTSFNNADEKQSSALERNYYPFLFSENSSYQNTEFESIHSHNGYEYQYGFIYNSNEVVYEWLYKKNFSTGRKSVIIERDQQKITLGSAVEKSCGKYIEQIEKNILALSFFNRLKTKTNVFKDAFHCVTNLVPFRLTTENQTESRLNSYFKEIFHQEGEKAKLLGFLSSIDIGIKNITVDKNNENIEVKTHHLDSKGNEYMVPLAIESDGTRKVIALYSIVSIAIKYGKGALIDELNMQLHPLVLKFLIDLFYSKESEGQLIYTTHDTTLLDKKFFRRDQLWFVEKNEWGEATLYSMAEFKVRNDSSFDKDYLGGQYGAIPILHSYSWEAQDGN